MGLSLIRLRKMMVAVAMEFGEGEEGRRKLGEEEGEECDFIYL